MWAGLLKASSMLILHNSSWILSSFSFSLRSWMLMQQLEHDGCVAASRALSLTWRSALIASAGGLVHQSLHCEADLSQALALQDVMRKTQVVLEGQSHRAGGMDENHGNRKRMKGQEEKTMIKWLTYSCIKTEKCMKNTGQQGRTGRREIKTHARHRQEREEATICVRVLLATS